MVRVFANDPGDLGSSAVHILKPGDSDSIPGRFIPETLKIVFDATLLNTQHYKVSIKGKVEQSKERSSPRSYTLV